MKGGKEFGKKLGLLLLVVLVCFTGLICIAGAASFGIGDTVEVYNTGISGLVVRGPNACDGQIDGKFDGDLGVVLEGPVYCNSYYRWKIRWEDGLEGWSAEDWLREKYITPSIKFNINDKIKVNTGGSNLNVRTDPPELAYKGSVSDGKDGIIIDGPFYGVPKGDSGFWHFWKIDYGDIIGWSAENYLDAASADSLHQLPATTGKISYFASDDGHPGVCNPAAWGELLGENCGTDDATKYWYCAMRWPYYDPDTGFFNSDAKAWWHNRKILVTNPKNSKQVILAAKDWGPAEWTDRVIDVSKTALDILGAVTDDIVNIEFADQSAPLGPFQSISGYNRQAAYNYAQKYWNKVVSDGYFFEVSYPPSYLGAEEPVPSGGFDCAHFVSCCIGNEPHEQGGGLDVPSRTEAYGEPGADKLIKWLIDSGNAVYKTSINELERGDVIGYDLDNDGYLNHVVLYIGNGKIAAHSVSYWNENWDIYKQTYPNFGYYFIHIKTNGLDQPPTCSIELRGQGTTNPINEININEFFDIYVGDSTDDNGIEWVHFSSDESQDDIPQGTWTDWYDWGVSFSDWTGIWDATRKVKTWAFTTPGIKEVWAEVKDNAEQTFRCSADIYANPLGCASIDTSCGIYPNCANCNNNDGCYGDYSRDYYCFSNEAGCSYTSDDCSDCSCSCGGYNIMESLANGNCNDGKDNDCDSKIDSSDSGCTVGGEWKSPSSTAKVFPTACGWTNPTYAYESDNQYTKMEEGLCWQYWTGYDFGIPAGSIIEGIEVEIDAYSDNNLAKRVNLYIYEKERGFNTKTGSLIYLSGSEETYGRGGPDDLWGQGWDASDFEGDHFRVTMSEALPVIYADQIRVRIYYTEAPLKGDVDGNCVVNIFDLAAVGLAYGSKKGDANWNENADVTGDGKVNIFDLATVGLNYGRTC